MVIKQLTEISDDLYFSQHPINQPVAPEPTPTKEEAQDDIDILTDMMLARGQNPKVPFNEFAVGTLGMHPDEVGMTFNSCNRGNGCNQGPHE